MILKIMMMLSLLNSNKKDFIEITNHLSIQEFEYIKNYVLKHGNRQTYRNFDNNNPHFEIEGFHLFLNAEIGQKNINNDPAISGFNEITLYDVNSEVQYYTLRIVREGDIDKEEIFVNHGMKENHVYLMNTYDNDLGKMKNDLLQIYLPKIPDLME